MATRTKPHDSTNTESNRNGAPMELVSATLLGLALTSLAWIYAWWALR